MGIHAGCHIHEMKDGTWAVYFDEIPQKVGYPTGVDAHAAATAWIEGLNQYDTRIG